MTRMTEPGQPAGGVAVRLTATLPKADANGLGEIAKALIAEPRTMRYAVIAYDVRRRIDDVDDDTETAVVRIQRIEPLTGKPADQARTLLIDAATARLGEGQLDFTEDAPET